MRLLLVLFLIHGMVPAIGEVAEAAVHYAVAGHLAHTDADHGDLGDQGDEHGCSPTQHRCACCAGQPLAAPAVEAGIRVVWADMRWSWSDVDGAASRSLDPPFRPPIA